MKKILFLITLLFLNDAYGSVIKEIDAVYDGKVFEIDFAPVENCKVKLEKVKGKFLEASFFNCSVSKRYEIGNRGDFVKKALILPTSFGFKVDIYLNKKGELRFIKRKEKGKLTVVPADYVVPIYKLSSKGNREELTFEFPVLPKKVEYSKTGKVLYLKVFGIKLKEGNYSLPQNVAFDGFSVKSSDKVSEIEVKLKRIKALEVGINGNKVSLEAFVNRQQLAFDKLKPSVKKEKKLEISLKFNNADVRSVVEAIAQIAKFNVVFDPEVTGRVSINFPKPVPWEEALKAVLEPLGLTYLKTKDYIRILPKKKIIVQRKLEPLKVYVVKLQYVDAEKVASKLKELFQFSEKEKINTIPTTNSLLMNLTKTHYEEIMNAIKQIDKPEKQVMIKAKIVQIQSSVEKQLGFSWYISGFTHLGTPPATGLAGSYGFNTSGYTPLISPTLPSSGSKFANVPVGDGTLALGILNPSQTVRIELALKALEIDGGVKILSTPKVLTLNNQEASIEQGVEIPYRESTVGAGGATSYSISFKKASLILKVKPHVTGDNNIVMDIEVRKDSPNYKYISITGSGEPAIDTRNVKSTVRVKNGDTVVIGGIYEKTRNKNSTGVPVLSRIPLLGWLFKSEKVSVTNSNLLVFITPQIVK